MRMIPGMAMLAATALAGCAGDPPAGAPEYLGARVKQITDTEFAIGIEARNVDEYAYARCVAANHAKLQETASFGELPGPPLHTQFQSVDGKRVIYSYGVMNYTISTTGEPAPVRVMSVRETLAECEKNGIPTEAKAASAAGTG